MPTQWYHQIWPDMSSSTRPLPISFIKMLTPCQLGPSSTTLAYIWKSQLRKKQMYISTINSVPFGHLALFPQHVQVRRQVVNLHNTVLTEMEFLDINLTKDLILLLHAIQSLSIGRFLKKTRLYSAFKNTYKKNQRNKKARVWSWIASCRKEKLG